MPAGIQKKKDPNFTNVRILCNEYLDFLVSDRYNEDELSDYKRAIFEASMEALYGEEVWKFVNENMD
jgi:hypothetical protein